MGLTDVQVGILIASTVFLPVSTFFVCLRLFDRKYNKKLPFCVDDYTLICAHVFVLFWTISTIVWVSCYYLGVDGHLNFEEYRRIQINSYVNRLFYALGFDLAKVSIILFYLKLTNRFTQRKYWLLLVGILGFMILVLFVHVFILLVPCSPIADFWNTMGSDTCWPVDASARVVNGFAFTSEALIVLAPLPMLWLSGLTGRQRITLACMFSLGCLIILASALKLHQILRAQRSQPLYNTGIAYIWIAIECNTALLVAGLLPLKSLFEARFLAVKRRFSTPGMSPTRDETDSKRKASLVPSDPYDLAAIMTPQFCTLPAIQPTLPSNGFHHIPDNQVLANELVERSHSNDNIV